jgi:hypothetical protein
MNADGTKRQLSEDAVLSAFIFGQSLLPIYEIASSDVHGAFGPRCFWHSAFGIRHSVIGIRQKQRSAPSFRQMTRSK